MRALPLLSAGLLLGLLSLPAAAAPFCSDSRNDGIVVQFGFHVGEGYTESEVNDFDLMRLRQAGIDATAVEKWNGCIRAYVRKPDGNGETMEFYDPNTLERVY